MKKKIVSILLSFACIGAHAADAQLLERALSCKLNDKELPSLLRDLSAQQPAFSKPVAQYGAPTANVYQLPTPVTAWGYTSHEVVVTPARMLLAVAGQTKAHAVSTLKLEESAFMPASRAIRPTVSVVAFQLSHQALANKLLVGCEYASAGAAQWPEPAVR